MLACSSLLVAQDGPAMALRCARICLPALRVLHLPLRTESCSALASGPRSTPGSCLQRLSRRPLLLAATADGRSPADLQASQELDTTPGEILTQAAQTGVATSTLVLGELFSMLGAQPEVRAKAAAVASEAAAAASGYAVLDGDGGGHGDSGNTGSGGGRGRDGDGGHQGSPDENSFSRGAPLLLVALAALACAASVAANQLQSAQKSLQWQPAEAQRQPATRTRVQFYTPAGSSSSHIRRGGAGGSGGLLGAWSCWLPRYPDPAAEGAGGSGDPEEAALATSQLLQSRPWSAGEPRYGFWCDERAGGGVGGSSSWARQGLSQSDSGASSRRRSDSSGVYGADTGGAEAGLRLPTSAHAAAGPAPGSGARGWGPRDPRVDFGDEISRLGSARDGLHAAHSRANKWLQEDASRQRGGSSPLRRAVAIA